MIWFDAKTAYGTPSYHVQKLDARNMGSYTLLMKGDGQADGDNAAASVLLEKEKVYANASFDETSGELILKVVNAGAGEALLELSTEFGEIKEGRAIRLEGPDRYAYNTIEEPDKVTTGEWTLFGEECRQLELSAESFTVYRFTI